MSFRKYAKYYDLLYKDKNYYSETLYILKIIKKSTKGKNILEIGCGTGSHAIELSKKGFKVFGIDNSKPMIAAAKKKSKNVEFKVSDARKFKFKEKFDIILLNFHVINFITNENELKIFFNNCYNTLSENGILLFDFINLNAVKILKPQKKIKVINYKQMKIIRTTLPSFNNSKKKLNISFKLKILNKGKKIDEFNELHKLKLYTLKKFKKLTSKKFSYISDFSWLKKHKLKNNFWTGLLLLQKKI